MEVQAFHRGEQIGSYRKFDERLTLTLLALSTQRGNVPVLGRRGIEAEGPPAIPARRPRAS